MNLLNGLLLFYSDIVTPTFLGSVDSLEVELDSINVEVDIQTPTIELNIDEVEICRT